MGGCQEGASAASLPLLRTCATLKNHKIKMTADLRFSQSPCVLAWAVVMHPTLLGSYPQLMFISHNPGAWGPEIRGLAQVGSGEASSQLYTRIFSWHPQKVEGVRENSGVHFTKALMPSWGSILMTSSLPKAPPSNMSPCWLGFQHMNF